ncbi:putative IMPACT [Cardiosporidium cionae]|uniref:IMPACT n=1 Tax=Cardiosporidium cionae TaxID=476202 RepID=A0ABQ7J856_9APIC|nr:putative IMPACT [Cardiosporidium cionae]|eukprot:KAF8820179.1 putative IMPACT [Cardiosporidium cionae]
MLNSSNTDNCGSASLSSTIEEELEALLAIYGSESIAINRDARVVTYRFFFSDSISEEKNNISAKDKSSFLDNKGTQALQATYGHTVIDVQFYLPIGYPGGSTGPEIEIIPAVIDSMTVKDIKNAATSLFQSGNVTLFQSIECIREKLDIWYSSTLKFTQRELHTTLTTCSPTISPKPYESMTFGLKNIPREPSSPAAIHHGNEIIDRKSVFQAHAAEVYTLEEVKAVQNYLLDIPKIARATHNILAYRLSSSLMNRNNSANSLVKNIPHMHLQKGGSSPSEIVLQDHDSDGENASGGRVQHLLITLGLVNVMVIVTRWYGGKKLGPDRFKHINNAARDALEKGGFITSTKNSLKGISPSPYISSTKKKK